MGQPPNDNPFGNCAVCSWSGNAPVTVLAIVGGIAKPTLFPDFPDFNGLKVLRATAICRWEFEDACGLYVWSPGSPAGFAIQIDVDCMFPKREVIFSDFGGSGCKTDFTNQLIGNPSVQYTGGTVAVFNGVPVAASEWVTAYGYLPPGNWKYEQRGANNGLEQIYLGSRKYKTNCRILYDPAELES